MATIKSAQATFKLNNSDGSVNQNLASEIATWLSTLTIATLQHMEFTYAIDKSILISTNPLLYGQDCIVLVFYV